MDLYVVEGCFKQVPTPAGGVSDLTCANGMECRLTQACQRCSGGDAPRAWSGSPAMVPRACTCRDQAQTAGTERTGGCRWSAAETGRRIRVPRVADTCARGARAWLRTLRVAPRLTGAREEPGDRPGSTDARLRVRNRETVNRPTAPAGRGRAAAQTPPLKW